MRQLCIDFKRYFFLFVCFWNKINLWVHCVFPDVFKYPKIQSSLSHGNWEVPRSTGIKLEESQHFSFSLKSWRDSCLGWRHQAEGAPSYPTRLFCSHPQLLGWTAATLGREISSLLSLHLLILPWNGLTGPPKVFDHFSGHTKAQSSWHIKY